MVRFLDAGVSETKRRTVIRNVVGKPSTPAEDVSTEEFERLSRYFVKRFELVPSVFESKVTWSRRFEGQKLAEIEPAKSANSGLSDKEFLRRCQQHIERRAKETEEVKGTFSVAIHTSECLAFTTMSGLYGFSAGRLSCTSSVGHLYELLHAPIKNRRKFTEDAKKEGWHISKLVTEAEPPHKHTAQAKSTSFLTATEVLEARMKLERSDLQALSNSTEDKLEDPRFNRDNDSTFLKSGRFASQNPNLQQKTKKHDEELADAVRYLFSCPSIFQINPNADIGTTQGSTMKAITITTQTLINGTKAENFDNASLYDLIASEEKRMADLAKIVNKPQRLKDELAERQAGIDALVALLDGRDAKVDKTDQKTNPPIPQNPTTP
jgi:hypothetical protein